MTLTSGFLPHSICLALDPWLVGLHALSDLIAAISYYFIPVFIVIFATRRKDMKYRWALWLCAAFVLACGTTHVLSAVTLWKPVYVLQGYAKAVTAAISLFSAMSLWFLLPKVVSLPSPEDLRREIEERRRAEAQLREMNATLEEKVSKRTQALEAAKAEAEHANLAKSRFLAAASHDLRQPVQAMRLLLELIHRKMEDPQVLRTLCGRMDEAVDSTEVMLSSLMEFAALESGHVAMRTEVIRLDQLLARLVSEQAAHAAHKGLALHLHATPISLKSDSVLLGRILRNLLVNAIRYTDHGGVLIGIRRRCGKARIEVWDTGIGIPADKHRNIFEEFYQVGNVERDRSKGTGLGLTIAARTATVLGCTLEVASRECKGSMFAVTLPDAPITGIERNVGSQQTVERKGSILLVEDDAAQAVSLEMILRDTGHEVLAARDLDSAIKLIEGAKPDLVLCDYRLPDGVVGTSVIKEIRNALGRDVPAIILTGDTQAWITDEARAVGAAILNKPYNLPDLTKLIAELLILEASV